MTRLTLCLCLLALSACVTPAPVYYVTPLANQVLPAEAQRIIDGATATAGAVATAQAVRTQDWQATVSAEQLRQSGLLADATATAQALRAQATLTAIPATVQALALAMDAARRRATETAEAERRAAAATLSAVETQIVIQAAIQDANLREAQYRAEIARQDDERWSKLFDYLLILLCATLGIASIIGALWLDGRRRMHLAKLQAEIITQCIQRIGDDLVIVDPVTRQTTYQIRPALAAPARARDQGSAIPEVGHVPILHNGAPLPRFSPAVERARELLIDALDYAEQTENWPANKLPRWSRLKEDLGKDWSPDTWGEAVKTLGHYVEVGARGTFINRLHATDIQDLLTRIDTGQITL